MGMFFFDEVVDMLLMMQVKVLCVVEEQSFELVGGQKMVNVDVWLFVVMNKDLEVEIVVG